MATPSWESDGLSLKKNGSVWWSRAVSPPWNSSTILLASRIGSTPLISCVSGPITPLTCLVRLSSAAGVDLALRPLRALDHRLPQAGQPSGEARQHAIGDRAARPASPAGTAA